MLAAGSVRRGRVARKVRARVVERLAEDRYSEPAGVAKVSAEGPIGRERILAREFLHDLDQTGSIAFGSRLSEAVDVEQLRQILGLEQA
jgi:hypothetical protein